MSYENADLQRFLSLIICKPNKTGLSHKWIIIHQEYDAFIK